MKARARKFTLDKSASASTHLLTQKAECGAAEIVVSLTTYGHRFHDVYLAIESIAHQTLRPSRLILWLDASEYKGVPLPMVLQRQIERGLEVRLCPNIRSYKKLIPALEVCPEATIVTIDDDVLYPKDMLQQLVTESQVFPGAVIAHRARRIKFLEDALAPYADWEYIVAETSPSRLTVPIGIGGVLYPSNTFYADISATSEFERLAPNADDIWFKAMSLLRGVKCKKTSDTRPFESRFLDLPNSQYEGLHRLNLGAQENDKQIASVFEKYDICDLLRS
jgi:hypothetical protein